MVAAFALVHGQTAPAQAATADDSVQSVIEKVNDLLETQGAPVRLLSADLMTRAGSGTHGRKLHWRGKRGYADFDRMDAEFVPFDARRKDWSGPVDGAVDDITFAIDQSADAVPPAGGVSAAETTRAIRRATATWDRVKCSGLVLREVQTYMNTDIGLVAWVVNGANGVPPALFVADIVHAGFGSLKSWKDVSGPSMIIHDDIVAVTFTFGIVGADMKLTDIDDNKKWDIGFHEIYYNPGVKWTTARGGNRHDDDDDEDDRRGRKRVVEETFDVETVALHEIGHALSLEHYGEVVKRKDGTLDAKPEAVMNPGYTGVQRRLQRADVAAHCIGGWKNWPRAKRNRGRDDD